MYCATFMLVSLTLAEPPPPHTFNGYGNVNSGNKGFRYAGPIVYTNEKPPVIHFPPPPAPGKVSIMNISKPVRQLRLN